MTKRPRNIWFGNNSNDAQKMTTFAGVVERNDNFFREKKCGGSAGENQAIFTIIILKYY